MREEFDLQLALSTSASMRSGSRLDQAAGLRSIFRRPLLRVLPVMGAAGAGAIAARLAECASAFENVVLLDQTDGDALRELGVLPRAELQDWLDQRVDWTEAVVRAGRCRLMLGQQALARSRGHRARAAELFGAILTLPDAASLAVLHFASATSDFHGIVDGESELLLVVAPGRAAVRLAYAQIKHIHAAHATRTPVIRVLISGASSAAEGERRFDALAAAARKFLGIRLLYAGALPVPSAPSAASDMLAASPSSGFRAALAQVTASITGWQLASHSPAPGLSRSPHLQ